MDDPRLAAIQAIAEPMLAERAVELVELTCRPQGRQLMVRFLVDKVGGVMLQQCAQLNQLISNALETANLIEESYTIEVSSPGLDRPLASRRDFERALGEELAVQCRGAEDRITTVEGMLLAIQTDAIVLKTTSGNLTLPFAQIHAAKKALRW